MSNQEIKSTICEHNSLRRSCVHCELSEVYKEVDTLISSLELAVKALQEILECGSTGEDARDMHRIADYTLDQIRGEKK